MKERMLDVLKWALILLIAGAVFYQVYPKYYFKLDLPRVYLRGNMITGNLEYCADAESGWKKIDKEP